MVEVFKTNVNHTLQAKHLADVITTSFVDYKVNFDLDDCDRIMRVEAPQIDVNSILELLSDRGLHVQVLPDFVESMDLILLND